MRPSFHQIVGANALGSEAEQIRRGNLSRILLLRKETLLMTTAVTVTGSARFA